MRMPLCVAGCLVALTLASKARSEPDASSPVSTLVRGFELGVLGGAGYDTMGYGRSSALMIARYFATDDVAIGIEGGVSLLMDRELDQAEGWDEDRMSFAGHTCWAFLSGPIGASGMPAYDTHLIGAIGIVSSQPVPLEHGQDTRVALSATAALGVGFRLALTPWLSILLEGRDDVWLGTETRQIGVGRLGLSASLPVVNQRAGE